MMDWLGLRRAASHFFVQTAPKEPWHVESEEHCEYMLCGFFISVDHPTARIRTIQPARALGCLDCWIKLNAPKR